EHQLDAGDALDLVADFFAGQENVGVALGILERDLARWPIGVLRLLAGEGFVVRVSFKPGTAGPGAGGVRTVEHAVDRLAEAEAEALVEQLVAVDGVGDGPADMDILEAIMAVIDS